MESEDAPKFKSDKVKKATALMLENQFKYSAKQGFSLSEKELNEGLSDPGTSQYSGSLGSGDYDTNGFFHRVAIPMVRRTFPELIAHDLVGVQPLNGPVGLAFAMRFVADGTYDGDSNKPELGYNTIDSAYTGSDVTSAGEALGSNDDPEAGLGFGTGESIPEMSMTLEKTQAEAKTRKLRSR